MDLVDQDQICTVEHMGILSRSILTLRNRENDYFCRFAKVKKCRIYEVTHVSNEDHGSRLEVQLPQALCSHIRLQVTTSASTDLHNRHTHFADALGVVGRLLITLHDSHGDPSRQIPEGMFQ